MTDVELDEYERHQSAIHEAGHITVAAHYGRFCAAVIWREGNNGDESQKNWRGSAATAKCWDLGPIELAAVGIAGVAANCLHESSDYGSEDLVSFIEADVIELSETDWVAMAAVGSRMTYDELLFVQVAQAAMEILRRHTSHFDWCVSQLLKAGIVTEEMVAQRWHH